jgi:diacylglycerol kinase family enzyme
VAIGLHGARRALDVGVINGERFAVMAGAGFDARIMGSVGKATKKRLGRAAYVRSGVRAAKSKPTRLKIKVDGQVWFSDAATCVLFGNIGTITGGLRVFPDAQPDDGFLEVGVVTAHGKMDWLRVLGRIVTHDPESSPMVKLTRGRKATVRFDSPLRYELDGGARSKADKLRVRIEPGAISVCVPEV